MESVVTCKCGCHIWIIYDNRIECEECNTIVKISLPLPVRGINKMIKDKDNNIESYNSKILTLDTSLVDDYYDRMHEENLKKLVLKNVTNSEDLSNKGGKDD